MSRLLLIDDEPALIPTQVRQVFRAPEYVVEVATTGADGLKCLRDHPPDVVLLDLRLPDQSGFDVLQKIREIDARIPVIFVTSSKAADAAIDAMQQGAYDYLFKPLVLSELQRVVADAINVARRMREPALILQMPSNSDIEGAIVGTCPAMREVYKSIGHVAAENVPVLITGESGTGKELVALAIYQHGPRSRAPFLALNCAAIPENLLESELFGHEKGAFTGADRRRIGKFEQCKGGTILLDEIGDMPLLLQAKMLRLMQDQAFERLGGNQTIHTDVRLIAATHRDLKSRAAEGTFRQDLYFRLSGFIIPLPPLRERGDDLEMLVGVFIRRFSSELGREVRDVSSAAMDRLRSYSWPGNIRELQSVIRQAVLRTIGPVLLPESLPADVPNGKGRAEMQTGERMARDLPSVSLAELERAAIQQRLRETGGNRQRTAELLGISTRTLLRKIRTYQLDDPLGHVDAPQDDDESAP
jgi:two-component system nitrogen regulation response regulator GlnG